MEKSQKKKIPHDFARKFLMTKAQMETRLTFIHIIIIISAVDKYSRKKKTEEKIASRFFLRLAKIEKNELYYLNKQRDT